MIGMEHFFVYLHHNTDNTAQVMKPYVDRGLVTLLPFNVMLNGMHWHYTQVRL